MKSNYTLFRRALLLSFLISASCFAQGGSWTNIGPLPSTIIGSNQNPVAFTINHSTLGSQGYYMSGFNYGPTPAFYAYDTLTGTWEQKMNVPIGSNRQFSVGFCIGNFGYIGTGISGPSVTNDFHKYDPVLNAWSSVAPLPGQGRLGAIALSLNGKAVVGGGAYLNPISFPPIVQLSDYYEYDPSADAWSSSILPTIPLSGGATFTVNNTGYVISPPNVYAYQPNTLGGAGSWTHLNNFPVSGSIGFGFSVNGKGYAGGNLPNNAVYSYAPASDQWCVEQPLPSFNNVRTSFAIGNKGFLISFNVNSTTGTNDFLRYSQIPIFTLLGFNGVPSNTLCSSTFLVTVTSDCNINPDNIYTVYVSKAGFPTSILGTVAGNNNVTSIPVNTQGLLGNNYKLWVGASSPAMLSPNTLTGLTFSTTPNPPSVSISGPTAICSGLPQNYTSNATGAGINLVWSVTGPGSILTVSGPKNKNMQLLSNASGAIQIAAYAFNGAGCQSVPALLTVTNVSKPNPTITGSSLVCQNTVSVYSITSVSGVTYSWNTDFPNFTVSGSQLFVSSPLPGTFTITNTGYDVFCGTYLPTTFSVNVQQLYNGTISGAQSVCTNSTAFYSAPFQSLTSFAWNFSTPNASLNSSQYSATLLGISAGTGNLQLTATNACGLTTVSYPVTVTSTSLAVPIISGLNSICGSGMPYNYMITNIAPGVSYAWTFTGLGNLISAGYLAIVASTAPGTGTLIAEATNICGTKSVTPPLMINILSLPNASFSGPAFLCSPPLNAIPNVYTTTSAPNLLNTWNVSGPLTCNNCPGFGNTLNGQSILQIFPGMLLPGNTVPGVIALNVFDTNTGCSNQSTQNIPIFPVYGIPSISGINQICLGQNSIYTTPTLAGVSYTWYFNSSFPGQALSYNQNTATVTGTVAGLSSVLNVHAGYVCSIPDGMEAITVLGIPEIPTITGNSTICSGSVYTVAAQPGVTYSWSVSGTGIVTASGNTATISGSSAGSGMISVTAASSCGTVTSAMFAYTYLTVPLAPVSITGLLAACYTQSLNYSVTTVNGLNYTWLSSFPSFSTNGGNLSILSIPNQTALYAISVTASNLCGTSTATVVNVQIDQPYTGSISGNSLICKPLANGYTLPLVTGVTYLWSYNGAGAALTSIANNATLAGISYEVAQLTATASNSCGVYTITSPITVSSVPTVPGIMGSTQLCEQMISYYSVNTFAGETYAWKISGSGATYASSYNQAVLTASGAGTMILSVTSQSLCGSTGSATLNVNIKTYPAVPTISGCTNIQVGQTCGYMVSSLPGTSYSWTLSNALGSLFTQGNAATLTGFATGFVTVQLAVSNGICSSTATGFGVNITSLDCQQVYHLGPNDTYHSTVIGAAGITTTITGGDTFDGVYHILGSLVLTGGTYNFMPGTQFYVESDPSATTGTINNLATYITFSNANANIHQTLFTAACNTMWGGIVLTSNAVANMDTYSEIKDAYIAIYANANTQYHISNSSFVNNYDGLLDNYRNSSMPPVSFTNNAVTSNPDQLKAPYLPGTLNGNAATYYSYYGLYLSGDFANAVFTGNTITGMIFGIEFNGANITFSGNYFTNNVVFNMQLRTSGTTGESVRVLNNHVNMNNNTNYQAIFNLALSGASQRDGINMMGLASVMNNTVVGLLPDVSGTNPQRGISLSPQYNNGLQSFNVSDNQVSQVAQGVTLESLTPTYAIGISLSGNNMQNNLNGVYISAQSLYSLPADIQIKCNTFANTAGLSSVNGINVRFGNYLPDQGSPTGPPPGNKFVGYTGAATNSYGIVNNGNFFNYFVNLAEEILLIPGGSGGIGTPLTSHSAQCSEQGYHTGNGRMEALDEVAAIPLTIQQKMDSLQFKIGSANTLKNYQLDIVNYYSTSDDLQGLETYADSIVNCNREAYYTFYLYLMQTYSQNGDATSSTRCQAALLAPNPNDAEIKARISFFNLMQEPMQSPDVTHLNFNPNAPKGNLNLADSVALTILARSGTSVANSALAQLKQYYPLFNCNTDLTYQNNYGSINCDSQNSNARKGASSAQDMGTLGNAIPNPANNQTVISYVLSDVSLNAEIQIHELVTGRLMKVIPVTDKAKQGSVTINLDEFVSGIYSYKLSISGKTIDVKKLVVIK